MATIFLESTNKTIKRTELQKILTKLLYSTYNLEKALIQFNDICSGEIRETDDMILKFDAHAGDCGCHLRAQMLLCLIDHYRDPIRRQWINDIIQILSVINQNIITLYRDISQLNGNLRSLGFSSSIPLIHLFDRIGCKTLFAILDHYTEKNSSITHVTSVYSHRLVNANQWNLSNYRMVAQFISYCHLLSSHKIAIFDSNAKCIRYRLDPLLAFSEINVQLDQLARNALKNEIENMQVYITQLTCDWMIKLSAEIGLGQSIQRLLENSIRISQRGLYCMPAYPSILIIRFEWLVKRTPLFLVLRRFCTEGYHNAYYRISVNYDAIHHYIETVRQNNSEIVDLGHADWFNLISVSQECAQNEDWARQPHAIIIANSTADSMNDVYSRMINNHACRPHNGICHEYNQFLNNEFPPRNFSHTIMKFFAIHRQYPFDLPTNECQWNVIENIIESSLGHTTAAICRQTVNPTDDYEIDSYSFNLLNFQHIFAEFPIIIMNQTEQMILQNEIPIPYGCCWDENNGENVNSIET